MKLTNSFRIDRPPAEVFDTFADIERVATCLPGSKVLGRSDDVYDGELLVKVGPLAVAYTGQLRVLETDRDQLRLTLRAKGREQRGAGNADAHIVARLHEADGGTVVDIDTDLSIRGKVAQFGRGAITDVSAGIMQTFAGNLERMLRAEAEHGATEERPTGGPTSDRRPHETTGQAQGTPAAAAEGTSQALDAWGLVVKPLLSRHAGSIATVAVAGVAAYLGARLGVRHARRDAAYRWASRPPRTIG